ncbi:MAG: preprotein translocase subunit YajC [Deltaproteobacteria bacterium]|nr:preprotein translocase subunit YajC [Deltaproteobacteria bacterium]
MILMIVVMLGIMYFLLLRPQQKQQKRHQEFLGQLKKGDEVVTQAGILGKVYAVEEKQVVLEVADKVRIRVLRHAIAGDAPRAGEPERSDKTDKKEDADKTDKR